VCVRARARACVHMVVTGDESSTDQGIE
jgi:hypothetical protein